MRIPQKNFPAKKINKFRTKIEAKFEQNQSKNSKIQAFSPYNDRNPVVFDGRRWSYQ